MKKRTGDRTDLDRKMSSTPDFTRGRWSVTANRKVKLMADGPNGSTLVVFLKYNDRVVFQGHGIIAYSNAKDLAAHFHSTGYVPKRAKKCLADLTPKQRARSSNDQPTELLPDHFHELK